MRIFRNHGISTDHRQREEKGSWFYEMTELGYNYRITDIQCALGISQLGKLPAWLARRREIALRYDAAFSGMAALRPLTVRPDVRHAYHLYVVRLTGTRPGPGRGEVFTGMRNRGIGVNVHYVPVHLHPFYREHHLTHPGMCPVAEDAYESIISLPMWPGMSDQDVETVISSILAVCG
jgi:perosamine synthetase